jgi:hypothetical protein
MTKYPMTKECPSTKSKKTGAIPGNQAGVFVIRSSGFFRIWAIFGELGGIRHLPNWTAPLFG